MVPTRVGPTAIPDGEDAAAQADRRSFSARHALASMCMTSDQHGVALVSATHGHLLSDLNDWGPRIGADTGQPMTSGRVLYQGNGSETGIWRCTPGGWSISNRPDTESVLIIEGRALLTDADGTAVELSPGDALVLPRGWSGRWDILETVVKFYVTCTGAD